MIVPAAFVGSAALVIMTPGPDLALLTGILVREGRRAPAFGAAAGMICAGALYAGLGIAGVSVLLAHHPALVTALQVTGAVVLLGYGARTIATVLRGRAMTTRPLTRTGGRSFGVGFLSTAGNPKVCVFLLSFLPQFLPAERPTAPALALLAMAYLALVAVWLSCYVLALYRIRMQLRGPRARGVLEVASGCVLIGLGLRMIMTG